MPIGNLAAAAALELEHVRKSLPEFMVYDMSLYSLIKKRTDSEMRSWRLDRIPFILDGGGQGQGTTFDGDSLGLGSAPQTTYGAIGVVGKSWAWQWTAAAEMGTDSNAKAVENYAKLVLKYNLDAVKHDLDSLLSSDNAGTFGIVTAVTVAGGSGTVTVDRPERFRKNIFDYYNGGPGTTITGQITVSGIDMGQHLLYVTYTGAAPAINTYITFRKSNQGAAVAGGDVNGLEALVPTTLPANYMGVTTASYPGDFVTPAVNAGNNTVTPALARLMMNQLVNYADINPQEDRSRYVIAVNTAQMAAWENTGINVTQTQDTAGNVGARDPLPAVQIETIGGVAMVRSRKLNATTMRMLDLNSFFMTLVQDIDYYSVGSQETFQVYGTDGGVATSFLKYLTWVGNVGCDNSKRNVVMYNLTVPTSYS